VSNHEFLTPTQNLNTRDSEIRSLLFCICWLRNWSQCSAFANTNSTAGLSNPTALELSSFAGAYAQLKPLTLSEFVCLYNTHTASPTSAPNGAEACGSDVVNVATCTASSTRFHNWNNVFCIFSKWKVFDINHKITSLQWLISSSDSVSLFKCAVSFVLHKCRSILRKFLDKINNFLQWKFGCLKAEGTTVPSVPRCQCALCCCCYNFSLCVLFRDLNFFTLAISFA
jgi:hypothetical protein